MRSECTNDALTRSLSRERLTKYLAVTDGDTDSALSLYERNMRLSEAFHTPLHCFEITLRNALNDRMRVRFGAGWLRDASAPLDEATRNAILRAIENVSDENPPDGSIVAELNLGFWVGLIAQKYDATLWRMTLHQAFRATGRGIKRSLVHGRVNALRRFRNRVAHHEPIFDRDLERVHAEIIETIGWICPETAQWTACHSRFEAAFNEE